MIVDPYQQLQLAGLRIRTFKDARQAAETLSSDYQNNPDKGNAVLVAMEGRFTVRELIKMQMATEEGQLLLMIRGLPKLRYLCLGTFPS
jgi:hypothetical protein